LAKSDQRSIQDQPRECGAILVAAKIKIGLTAAVESHGLKPSS